MSALLQNVKLPLAGEPTKKAILRATATIQRGKQRGEVRGVLSRLVNPFPDTRLRSNWKSENLSGRTWKLALNGMISSRDLSRRSSQVEPNQPDDDLDAAVVKELGPKKEPGLGSLPTISSPVASPPVASLPVIQNDALNAHVAQQSSNAGQKRVSDESDAVRSNHSGLGLAAYTAKNLALNPPSPAEHEEIASEGDSELFFYSASSTTGREMVTPGTLSRQSTMSQLPEEEPVVELKKGFFANLREKRAAAAQEKAARKAERAAQILDQRNKSEFMTARASMEAFIVKNRLKQNLRGYNLKGKRPVKTKERIEAKCDEEGRRLALAASIQYKGQSANSTQIIEMTRNVRNGLVAVLGDTTFRDDMSAEGRKPEDQRLARSDAWSMIRKEAQSGGLETSFKAAVLAEFRDDLRDDQKTILEAYKAAVAKFAEGAEVDIFDASSLNFNEFLIDEQALNLIAERLAKDIPEMLKHMPIERLIQDAVIEIISRQGIRSLLSQEQEQLLLRKVGEASFDAPLITVIADRMMQENRFDVLPFVKQEVGSLFGDEELPDLVQSVHGTVTMRLQERLKEQRKHDLTHHAVFKWMEYAQNRREFKQRVEERQRSFVDKLKQRAEDTRALKDYGQKKAEFLRQMESEYGAIQASLEAAQRLKQSIELKTVQRREILVQIGNLAEMSRKMEARDGAKLDTSNQIFIDQLLEMDTEINANSQQLKQDLQQISTRIQTFDRSNGKSASEIDQEATKFKNEAAGVPLQTQVNILFDRLVHKLHQTADESQQPQVESPQPQAEVQVESANQGLSLDPKVWEEFQRNGLEIARQLYAETAEESPVQGQQQDEEPLNELPNLISTGEEETPRGGWVSRFWPWAKQA